MVVQFGSGFHHFFDMPYKYVYTQQVRKWGRQQNLTYKLKVRQKPYPFLLVLFSITIVFFQILFLGKEIELQILSFCNLVYSRVF